MQVQRPPLKVGEVRNDSLPTTVCKRLTGSFLVKITSTDNSHLGYLAEVDCDGIVPVASDPKSITDTDQILRQQRLQQIAHASLQRILRLDPCEIVMDAAHIFGHFRDSESLQIHHHLMLK